MGNLLRKSDDDEDDGAALDDIPHTVVPSQYFATPVPVTMSGGTAAFFHLKYAGPASGPPKEKYGRSPTYWLGKDVARALDELPFYEDLIKLDLNKYKLLRDWTMDYVGILNAPVAKGSDMPDVLEDEARDLLVIHDIADGLVAKRMLDIKIGKETAVAGWRGKSANAARMNRAVDEVTNSVTEGYRLEGFDNQPSTLASQDIEQSDNFLGKCKLTRKKINRVDLQCMPFRLFCRYWCDMNDMATLATSSTLTVAENSEAVLFDAVRQLAQLCVDARQMPVSQMWIGSSLCLACDSGRLESRRGALERLASPRPSGPSMQKGDLAKVCAFDWGRSELNTIGKNKALNASEQAQREKYWKLWQYGAVRAFYEATSLYLKQCCFTPDLVTIEVWDFDTGQHNGLDPSDLLGSVEIPLKSTNGPVDLDLDQGSITVEVTEIRVPTPSRLQRMWCVYVHSVANLPRSDLLTASDPQIRVLVGNSFYAAIGETPVIWNDPDAEFDCPIHFGKAAAATEASLLSGISSILGATVTASMFDPSEEDDDALREAKYQAFLRSVPVFSALAD